jgi:hypothetical protein
LYNYYNNTERYATSDMADAVKTALTEQRAQKKAARRAAFIQDIVKAMPTQRVVVVRLVPEMTIAANSLKGQQLDQERHQLTAHARQTVTEHSLGAFQLALTAGRLGACQ